MIEVKDEILLDRLKNGDVDSLGTLYERYKERLFNYFLRSTGNYEISNDLLMETFERVYKYRGSYKTQRKVRPWLFQIATNLLKDSYKKSTKFMPIDERISNLKVVKADEPTDVAYRNKQLEKALLRLKPKQRQIVNMYYLLEMSYEDIAIIESISINSVRIKVCRALKKLKELLKDSEL
ncbi:RNA polymerase sigma factor [Winogradskyella sp.]|uniref:RNA polymerase sigma factor n=1 Tax=Winogradskyella sp. TaxID=1883156 RepID=UPI003BAA0A28